jgi:nucleotide-binding universal stress UspA family protein
MIQITSVLCPIDFSDVSRRALEHAAAIAHWYGARLTVAYVFPNLIGVDLPPIVLEGKDREQVAAELKQFAARVPATVPLDVHILEAPDVHREILLHAQATRADLLVIGSHGRSGVERLLLGSVTEKVMRKAPCPTMIVPARAADRSPDEPVRFRSIVCPVDFSDGSLRAVDYALDLAREADAQLTLLHVVAVPPEPSEGPLWTSVDIDSLRRAAEADALRRLQELVPDEARTYCSVETVVREGAAYRQILATATERHAELIVMGVQGRGAIDLAVFGSNTARVARGAACPVLIVRPV